MNIIKGDLIQMALEGSFDVIIHGCNCFCTMQAGIAKQIQDNFPQALQVDLKTAKGDKTKLGTYSLAKIENNDKNKFFIINAYTQFNYSGHDVLIDYNAVKNVFATIKKNFTQKKIGYPKIGSGLANGDWNIISKIIANKLHGEDHTLVVLN